ncbi:MAG: hypothetical protein KBD50_02185 [Candidatus Pacebacteria bacterium]|nr:hypothetical protein [Candidatus Paceibacterota bacterium]
MDSVNFLNLEYILTRVYEVTTGVTVDVGEVPDYVLHIVGQLAILGMTLSVVFLALVVYVRIRIVFAEHEGFGEKDREMIVEESAVGDIPKNARWEHVRNLIAQPMESDWRRAIMEADSMLGQLLSDQGYRGSTIGEQLRDANPLQFTTLDLAWKAHKVRNEIAHGGEGYKLDEREAHSTIDLYSRVFEEFNFI